MCHFDCGVYTIHVSVACKCVHKRKGVNVQKRHCGIVCFSWKILGFNLGKSATEATEMIKSAYGESVLSYGTVKK